jgi:uncharacterized membrane protein HdeD (DUF308 family)
MSALNLTQICTMPTEKAITQVGQAVTLPSLILFLLGLAGIFLAIGMFSVNGRESKKKILSIWFLSLICGAFLLLGIYFNPNGILNAFQSFLNIFN